MDVFCSWEADDVSPDVGRRWRVQRWLWRTLPPAFTIDGYAVLDSSAMMMRYQMGCTEEQTRLWKAWLAGVAEGKRPTRAIPTADRSPGASSTQTSTTSHLPVTDNTEAVATTSKKAGTEISYRIPGNRSVSQLAVFDRLTGSAINRWLVNA